MADIGKIEYRVRETTRYIVTRYHESASGATGGSEEKGEYENPDIAHEVAYALCKEEHRRLGFPPGDERIRYPQHPRDPNAETAVPRVAMMAKSAG
jgi:hypothetical protein